MMQTFSFEPIGSIETCYRERFGTPRQPRLVPASWGRLKLRPELNLADGLKGLEGFSHVWIIFVFHQNTNKGIKTKIHPPRMEGEKIGLFATRTPHRPNPVGLSVCKLERIEGDTVYLSGVDLIDGTPVLDIKPYVPSADCITEAHGGWTVSRPERTVEVVFSDEALTQIAAIEAAETNTETNSRAPSRDMKSLIRQTLELDPRPGFYKGTAERENPYTDVYGLGIEGFNVVYRMSGRVATVLRLEDWADWKLRAPPRDKSSRDE